MKIDRYKKYLCFTADLTLATRLIAFFGIAISVLLVTVLINDLSVRNFDIIRNIAWALGLDWRHLHPEANTSPQADPDGKIISALVIIYALLFFLTNICLLLAAIVEKPLLAIPWLVCEFVGGFSKLVGLIFHMLTEMAELNQIFIVGSLIYLVVLTWWWLVVYSAQSAWRRKRRSSLKETTLNNLNGSEFDSICLDSPEPYHTRQLYTTI